MDLLRVSHPTAGATTMIVASGTLAEPHHLPIFEVCCRDAAGTLMEGAHSLDTCSEVTERVLRAVFSELYTQRVNLECMILKPNMVLPGSTWPKQEPVEDVADATVLCLLRVVPAAVPGIAFLSGGQTGVLASARLNAMNVRFKTRLPWVVGFSFERAIQEPALEIWHGEQAKVAAAQQTLYHRAKCAIGLHASELTTPLWK